MWSAAFAFLSLPPWGKVAPQGRMRGRVCDYIPIYGSEDKAAPHPSVVGAADSFPRRGSLFTFKRKMTLATNAGTLVDMACGRMT